MRAILCWLLGTFHANACKELHGCRGAAAQCRRTGKGGGGFGNVHTGRPTDFMVPLWSAACLVSVFHDGWTTLDGLPLPPSAEAPPRRALLRQRNSQNLDGSVMGHACGIVQEVGSQEQGGFDSGQPIHRANCAAERSINRRDPGTAVVPRRSDAMPGSAFLRTPTSPDGCPCSGPLEQTSCREGPSSTPKLRYRRRGEEGLWSARPATRSGGATASAPPASLDYRISAQGIVGALRGRACFSKAWCSGSASRSLTHVGAWSLVFSHPRNSRSTLAPTSRCAATGLSSRWSMRRPAFRRHAPAV